MRKRMSVLLMTLGLIVALASPALAQTVQVGNQVAGPLTENVTVAGNEALADFPVPANLPLGTDAAFAGHPVPPNPIAGGINQTFDFNVAVAGVGAAENDVIAASEFLGPNHYQAGWSNLSVSSEN
jgi:hypothetical protein